MEYIDVTPTWQALIPALVHCAVRGETAEARQDAMSELLRLARIVDHIAAQKGGK